MMYISIFIICVAGFYSGDFFTGHHKYALPVLFPQLDRKPFNCRPCLTFHLTWVLSVPVAVITGEPAVFPVGLVCAFILFFALYIHNKSQIEK